MIKKINERTTRGNKENKMPTRYDKGNKLKKGSVDDKENELKSRYRQKKKVKQPQEMNKRIKTVVKEK